MNTDAERNERELVRQLLRYSLYFNSVYHNRVSILDLFPWHRSRLWRSSQPNSILSWQEDPPSTSAEGRGSIPLFSLEGYVDAQLSMVPGVLNLKEGKQLHYYSLLPFWTVSEKAGARSTKLRNKEGVLGKMLHLGHVKWGLLSYTG